MDAAGKGAILVKLAEVQHIWALSLRGTTLYAGTGPGGKIFAVDTATKAEFLKAPVAKALGSPS